MLCFSFCCYVFPVVTLLSRLRMTMYIGHITNCILHYMLCMSLFITSIHICSRWYPSVACWVCCKFSVICSYLKGPAWSLFVHVYLCFLSVLLLSPIILFSSEESSSFADMLNVDRQVMSRNVAVVGLFVK